MVRSSWQCSLHYRLESGFVFAAEQGPSCRASVPERTEVGPTGSTVIPEQAPHGASLDEPESSGGSGGASVAVAVTSGMDL
jgi:hypothetical protein